LTLPGGGAGEISSEDLAAFGRRLQAFAADRSPHERSILEWLLVQAMDPLERRRYLGSQVVLSDDEEALLRTLESET
jgi:hypothetical protein